MSPVFKPLTLTLVAAPLLVGLLAPAALRAQTPAPAPAFQVLQQQVAEAGDHRVILNRVAPPPPQSTPAPALSTPAHTPAAASRAAAPKRVARAATASAATLSADPDADTSILSLSVTAYDAGRFCELRGTDAAGPWRAWSNLDATLLAPVLAFRAPEGSGPTYSLVLGLGTDTSDWLLQVGQYPAGVASLPAGQASYYFADGGTAAMHPGAATALDALHLFVDANRPALLQARQQREADQITHEAQMEYARQHPTPVPDTVINFWPKQNSVFLGH